MKVSFSQKAIMMAINGGGAAALSPEGKNDENQVKNATKGCILVKAGDSVSFESGVSRMAARYEFPGGVEVIEPGSVCIPVKELKPLLSAANGDRVLVESETYEGADDLDHSKSVQSDGVISVTVYKTDKKNTDKEKVQVEARYATYPASQFDDLVFATESVILKGPAKVIRDAYSSVVFAIDASDFADIYNKVGIFFDEDGKSVCFVGTDTHRCAIVQIPKEDLEVAEPMSLLLDAEILTPTFTLFPDDSIITFVVNETKTMVVISDGITTVRISMVDEKTRNKFPNWRGILSMPTKKSFVLNRESLVSALKSVSIANRELGVYIFEFGKDQVSVSAKSITDLKGVTAMVDCEESISEELQRKKICLSTKYFNECAQRLTDDKITLAFTPDESKCSIRTNSDGFIYLMQRMTEDEE